ncbi:PEP-CTERM sorting domain-containing protein [Stieleria sedimenti]
MPEPSSCVLLLLITCVLVMRTRRRRTLFAPCLTFP